MGEPDQGDREQARGRSSTPFPAKSDFVNRELVQCSCTSSRRRSWRRRRTLKKPIQAAAAGLAEVICPQPRLRRAIANMLENAPDQQKTALPVRLRNAKVGWTLDRWKVVLRLRLERGPDQERRRELSRASSTTSRRTPSPTPPTPSGSPSRRPGCAAVQAEGTAQAAAPARSGHGRRRCALEPKLEGPELQERRAGVRRGPVRRLPPLRRRRRGDRPGPDAVGRAVQPEGHGRGDRRAEQGDLRPVQGVGRVHQRRQDLHGQDRRATPRTGSRS